MSEEPNFGDVRVSRDEHGKARVSVPEELMPQLSTWTGRIQRETDVPVDVSETMFGYAQVTSAIYDQVVAVGHAVEVDFESLYQAVKTATLQIRALRQERDE